MSTASSVHTTLSVNTSIENYDINNGKFLLKTAIDSLSVAIDSLGSPVSTVSETVTKYLTPQQITAIENAFLIRTTALRAHLAEVKRQYTMVVDAVSLRRLQRKQQNARDHYMQVEQVFDYYVDLLHTRSERGVGPLLSGCDKICRYSIMQGLKKLGLETPTVVCYLDRGEGASILKSGIYLWDGQKNPAAIIKVVRSAVPLPRLTSILHECGHQAAHMTNWNKELAQILYASIIEIGGSKYLADLWSSWTSEIAADFWALHQCNFASVMGLYEVVTGSSDRVFRMIPGDPHPMAFLRVMIGLTFCKMAFGSGPWDDFMRVWQLLYPVNATRAEPAAIANESLPLLPAICKAISNTKMNSFLGNSLNQILPWDAASPIRIKEFLNHDLSNFRVTKGSLIDKPILALTSFRMIQMFGARSHEWIIEQMRRWLTLLNMGEKEGVN
jgi:hypothetical protein